MISSPKKMGHGAAGFVKVSIMNPVTTIVAILLIVISIARLL
jgi:hypothetical protein